MTCSLGSCFRPPWLSSPSRYVLSGLTDLIIGGFFSEAIKRQIVDSQTWVHRSDINLDGRVSEVHMHRMATVFE